MSSRRTEAPRFRDIFVNFVIYAGLSVVGLGVVIAVSVYQDRGPYIRARRHVVPHLANPRSLQWVRGLMPADEGMVWLAEVTSLLTEWRYAVVSGNTRYST
ncbi:MAG TPA: hypothetical protein VJT72_21265 [Pseudonocardiaceae bacterium]|nr:hypothetical protein [Pseudonocardiaceae bacterium]